MDHPSRPNRAVSDVSSKDMEDHLGPWDPEAQQASEPNEDREYGCTYCDKKFSNKQALGGHQNAHKVERAVEKSAREMQNNVHFGYNTGPGPMAYPGMGPTGPFFGPYSRSHNFLDRSSFNFLYNVPHTPQQPGIHINYGAPIGLSGGPRPRNVPRFLRQDSTFGFPNVGSGSSGHSRPIFSNLLGFGGSGRRPRENVGVDENRTRMYNLRNDQEPDNDSGLDLSLKL
ncbi:C2H2 and C2HC zinc fingers superfamily protein [Striga hermonthica]|uniref:C2H2 and C2HC zinc fingers superfamily protein n=1 Tax=Striga hermonthica TaxID=68872 RepID=A0A9N7R2Z9_STRHE|nr:C2H2 and C2HC zinc fingers superfamily protein [Striga hermonthica]